jgi:predicted RNase H-like HicB family nuclease
VEALRFSVIVERDEDGLFIGSIPELPGCHTQAKTIDELMDRIKEAAELYLEVEETDRDTGREFVGIQFLEVLPRES